MMGNAGILGKSEQCLNTALTLNDLTGGHQLPDQDSNTRFIPLTRGKFAIVDAADYEWLNQWNWHAHFTPHLNQYYAVASIGERRPNGIRRNVRMHRLIMDAPRGMQVDHINGNGLDNRRSNLRLATSAQNQWNRGPMPKNTSGYKGVTRNGNKWRATMQVHGKMIYVGLFASPEEAYAAYLEAAKKYRGEFEWRPDSR